MKVSELIELLQKMPQELEIITDAGGCGYQEPYPIIVELNDVCKRAYNLHNKEYVEI